MVTLGTSTGGTPGPGTEEENLASLAATSLAILNGESGFHQPPPVPWGH